MRKALHLLCILPCVFLGVGLYQNSLGANPVEVLTHETGIWGLRFLLLSLTITPFRKFTRIVWITQWRRPLGLYSFFYALVHFSIYFALDQNLTTAYFWQDVIELPYITLGFIALLGLLPLAATSTFTVRRRMGRVWNTLHSIVYAIGLLAVAHFLWSVKADYLESLIYALVYSMLMVIRVKELLISKSTGIKKGVKKGIKKSVPEPFKPKLS